MEKRTYIKIDFSQLEKEFEISQTIDNRKSMENDAKFRAVQQAANYDEFRDIVKACHLKPLGKKVWERKLNNERIIEENEASIFH